VQLVDRERPEVHAELLDVDRDLAGGLDRVGVEEGAAGVREGGELLQRLDRPDLVVRELDRDDEDRVLERLVERRR